MTPVRMTASQAQLSVRHALRHCLRDLASDAPVLVACSGGADSLALAAGAAAESRGRRTGAVVVDHGLQAGSAEAADEAARRCREWGLDPVRVVAVQPARGPGSGGPEAAARTARREALSAAAAEYGAVAVLLAHTRDDQAETVLLRLARGSGARALSGMAAVDGLWRRPLLGLARETVRASLADTTAWSDPHNDDPRFARVRVRQGTMPALVHALGPAVYDGLARSARLLRDDADALDAWTDREWQRLVTPGGPLDWDVEDLLALPRAVRSRLLRRACLACGAPGTDLTAEHMEGIEALVSDWHGQGALALPGGVSVVRRCGRLSVQPARGSESGRRSPAH
ncbi:MAG: tRNA lysidine(34) synthetase TilS [bacterium]